MHKRALATWSHIGSTRISSFGSGASSSAHALRVSRLVFALHLIDLVVFLIPLHIGLPPYRVILQYVNSSLAHLRRPQSLQAMLVYIRLIVRYKL